MEGGTYGRCEVCGEPIPAERLEVRPSARTCVRCADGRARG
nr:TraR/DksA C4-type zinc finger protein [Motilibacter deserti]